jgi:radical SAM family uncharacterized protein/radical SAM-linked protein
MLDLAGIPFRTADRGPDDPLILAGGPVAFNPEPMADYLDAVVLGDGEDVFIEICHEVKRWKTSGAPRKRLLESLAGMQGVYVPSLYDVGYAAEPVPGWATAPIAAITPQAPAPATVRRRFVEDLNRVPFPPKPVVPLGKTVQNRLGIEVQRGCTRACRFCQAGYIYRPERQRDPEQVKKLVASGLQSTGYDEVSLLSLSIGDYGCLDPLLGDLLGPNPRGTSNISVSLPSIRVDTLTEDVVEKIARGRKTGFTMAPEAGSPRLRDVINKALSEEQISQAADAVFQRGWSHIKFYYMIGLPTETDDDVMGIVRTARMCQKIGRQYTRKADIHVSTSTFVPKPFTPFQWEPQISRDEILRKQKLLRFELKKTGLTYRWHDSKESFLEAVLSRGDRRLAPVIEAAYRNGARLDSWREHFRQDAWDQAFATCGVEPGYYAHRRIPTDEVLPWDHIDCGVTKKWLLKDYERGVAERFTPDCATGRCYDCGVCDFEVVKNRTYISKDTGYVPQGVKAKGIGAHPAEIETDGKPRLAELLPPAPHVGDKTLRYRVRFEKVDRAAYLGHLELMEVLQRAFARAGIRVAYSQGYNPKPKFSFGPALMTGATSVAELVDVYLLEPPSDLDWLATVNEGLPSGVRLLETTTVETSAKKLGASITGARYEVSGRTPGALPEAQARASLLATFMKSASAQVETPKKTYDVRPYVVHAETTDDGFRIEVSVSSSTGSAKPTDIVRAILGWPDHDQASDLCVVKTETLIAGDPPAKLAS